MKKVITFFSLMLIILVSTITVNGETAARPTFINRHYFENGTHETRPLKINGDSTWTKANSPYVVENGIQIHSGATLRIEEGVRVLFSDETRSIHGVITVDSGGNLIVNGSLGQEVLFAPYKENDEPNFNWTSINIFGKGNINYGIFENGSGSGSSAIINIHSKDVLIENSILGKSDNHGITIFGEVEPSINRVRFEDLKGYAILQENINADPFFSELSTDNLNRAIKVQAHVDYTIGNPIHKEILWEDPSIPYIIDGWIYIKDGGVLNIEANTQIKFNPLSTPKKGSIIVRDSGELNADGVSFSSNELHIGKPLENWDYIYGDFGSTVNIKNSEVLHGGHSQPGMESSKLGSLVLNTSDSIIENTTIADGHSHGVYLAKANIKPKLKNLTISNNRGYGIYLKENAKPVYHSISQDTNDKNGVFLESKALVGKTKWGKTEGPYFLSGNYDVGGSNDVEASLLEIEPGVQVYFKFISKDVKSGINVNPNSKLLAKGTLESPIIFSSAQENPLLGDWDNIQLSKDSSGSFDYCNFEYGGHSNYGMLNLSTSKVSVENSYFANTSGSAIYLDSGVAPYEISKNQFNLDSNDFGIYKWDGPINVNATRNWWNHLTGPYNSTLNPRGEGAMVSDSIKFKPYETSSGGLLEEFTSLPSKYNVPNNKKWTIEFNNKLNKAYVNTSYVNVIDSMGNFVDIDVSLDNVSNKVIITPLSNYSSNEKYTLIVKQGIEDRNRNELNKGLKMDFHIK